MAVQFNKMFGYLILIIVATALAPTLFDSANISAVTSAPSWVVTLLPILVGVFMVTLLYRTANK